MKEGWEYKKLGEVSSFQNGFAFKSNLFRKEGCPIVRISNIQNEEILTDDIVYFNKEDYPVNFDNYRIFPNDILIAMSGGTTGKLGINTTNTIFYQNQRVGVIRENKKDLNHRFLFYFLHTKSEESLKIAAGAAQPNLSTAQIKDFVIPLPPLSEQQSIVDYLDSAFAKIDVMKANAEKALNEAKSLFQASLKEMLEPKEGWEEKTIGDVFTSIKNGANIKQTKGASGIPITRIETLSNDMFNRDRMGYANIGEISPYTSYILNEGDILMSHINSMKFLGRAVAYVKKDDEIIIHGMNLLRLVPKSDVYSPYMTYQFQTSYFRNQIQQISHQSVNQASFNITNLKGLNVMVPPLSEQHSIVDALDSIKSKVDRLQENFNKISQECDALKQSILRQVFE